jgi:hypothetical protein
MSDLVEPAYGHRQGQIIVATHIPPPPSFWILIEDPLFFPGDSRRKEQGAKHKIMDA